MAASREHPKHVPRVMVVDDYDKTKDDTSTHAVEW